MKRPFALLLLLFLSSPARAARLADIRKSGVLRLATEGAFPPFNFYQGKELSGFDVDLGNAVAAKMGLKPEWKTLPFDALLIGLDARQDRYDLVVASHGVTPERAKAVDFTAPYYCTGAILVARPGGPRTVKELDGKDVASSVGTTYLAYLRKLPGGVKVRNSKSYPKDTDCFSNLMAGRVAVWVTDRFVALKLQATQPSLQIGDMLFEERVAMAVGKGNAELKFAVDEILAELLKDGTYARLSEKYFHHDIRCVSGK